MHHKKPVLNEFTSRFFENFQKSRIYWWENYLTLWKPTYIWPCLHYVNNFGSSQIIIFSHLECKNIFFNCRTYSFQFIKCKVFKVLYSEYSFKVSFDNVYILASDVSTLFMLVEVVVNNFPCSWNLFWKWRSEKKSVEMK